MRRQGGKYRLRKWIIPILEANRAPNQMYLEPFAGACNVVELMSGMRLASDASSAMIAVFRALQLGWQPPHEVSEEAYAAIKAGVDADDNTIPPHLAGFVGFGCSWGGKWFAGYARDGKGLRNYADEAARKLEGMKVAMQSVVLAHCDYRDWNPHGMLVYADPPYRDTMDYKEIGPFDSDEFWIVMHQWATQGCTVFVSEFTGPAQPHIRTEVVWETEHKGGIRRDTANPKPTEKLFKIIV